VEAIETSESGVTYDKWQQLYLLINEWLEAEEEGDAFDDGWTSALAAVLDAINFLNEGKYPYEIH